MAKQNQNQQKPIPQTLNVFGKEWCFQGCFSDDELKIVKSNWKKNGHQTMVKKGNLLYVTRFQQ
jgi:hypothetical protein